VSFFLTVHKHYIHYKTYVYYESATSSSKRLPVDLKWGKYVPVPPDTVVRFVTDSKLTRKSPPFEKDCDSGDEVEKHKNTLAVTVGEQQQQGSLVVNCIHPMYGIQTDARLHCSSNEVEVINYIIYITKRVFDYMVRMLCLRSW
jgi:hypothetical protein